MRRRLSRGLTSLKGAAGDEAKACLASATKGVPAGAMLEFAISVYMMVQASPEDRALYIFSILDTNGDKQVRVCYLTQLERNTRFLGGKITWN